MSRSDFQIVKERVDIVEWARKRFGERLHKLGDIYRVNPCPIEGNHNDAFTIFPKTQSWKCFSCSKGGDIISLVQELSNFSEPLDALKELAREVGYELQQSDKAKAKSASRKELHELYADAMMYMHEHLMNSKKAVAYLQEKRGRTMEMIKQAKYGLADGKLHTYLLGKYAPELVYRSGLVRRSARDGQPYDLFVPNAFVYPCTANRKVVDFFSKEYFEPDKKKRRDFRIDADRRMHPEKFYGRDAIFTRSFVVVEGPEDRLSIMQYGGNQLPVVAMTGNPSQYQWDFIAQHCADTTIWDAFDTDAAGRKYSEKLLSVVAGKAEVMKLVWDEELGDIDDVLKKAEDPAQTWGELLAEGQDAVKWMINRLPEEIKGLHVSRQVARWEPICKVIAAHEEQFTREVYMDDLAHALGGKTKNLGLIREKVSALRNEKPSSNTYDDGVLGIVCEGNRYYRMDKDEKKCISEFVIRIQRYIEAPEGGMLYECTLINSAGMNSKPMLFDAAEQVNKKQFKEKCKDAGVGFHFRGTDADISAIWMLEEQRANISTRTVYRRCYGWLEDEKLWLVKNCAVQGREVYPLGEDGLVQVGNIQYKVEGVNLGMGAPVLNHEYKVSEEFIQGVAMHFWNMMDATDNDRGTPATYRGFLMMGYVMAVAYLEEILNYDRKFPYMLIYGPSGTGKSEAMLLLYNMFGFEQVGENWADGTAYGIAMALNELSSMPFWMEEYKNQKGNSKKQDNKIQMLNNIYNRVGSGKGGLDGRQVQQVRGTLIFTGQDRPEDKAMLSRCVVIMKDAPAEKGSKSYFALTGMRENLSSIFLWAIRNKTAENKRKIVELIQEIKDEIDKKIKERPKDERVAVDARAIYNHCVLAAGWCMYGMKQYDSEFVTWLSEMIVADVKRKSTEDIIYKFFSEIELNFGTNSMYGHLNDVMVYREPGRLYLWMSKIYKVWVREANSMAEYISLDALTEYMRNDPHDYWIGKERAILRSASKNKQQRCICLDVNKLPNNLRDIADCWLPEITDEY